MTDRNTVISGINESLRLTVEPSRPVTQGGASIFSWLVKTGDSLPPWWTSARDRYLTKAWKEGNHLSLAVYNTQAKITGIPPKIVSRDPTNPEWNDQAMRLEENLMSISQFGGGWVEGYARFVEDLITQDNGAFFEVIGAGPPDGPLVGTPVSVRHLDASRCTRTGHPIYPVIYMDENGKRWMFHYSRIIYTSQMPSSRESMYGVGFCAVSRSLNVAQTLRDMVRYKQQRLGSRPHNQMLVGKGITAEQIMTALRSVDEELDAMGMTNYARTVAIGSRKPDIGIEKIDLTHLEPFDEETSTIMGMYAIAAAFGMDADELWPISGRGTSKNDAAMRRRSRGRLPSQITAAVAAQFNWKFVPPHLEMKFDFRDDAEDQDRAIVQDIRARNRERDLGTGSANVRTARIQMMKDGDIDQTMFDELELRDGRLPDGVSVAALFVSDDPVYRRLLGGFMDNPLHILENVTPDIEGPGIEEQLQFDFDRNRAADDIIGSIQSQQSLVLGELVNTSSLRLKDKINRSYHALEWLETQYAMAAGRFLPPVPMQQRRMRTDVRIQPDQNSPEHVSPAEGASPAGSEAVEVQNNE